MLVPLMALTYRESYLNLSRHPIITIKVFIVQYCWLCDIQNTVPHTLMLEHLTEVKITSFLEIAPYVIT